MFFQFFLFLVIHSLFQLFEVMDVDLQASGAPAHDPSDNGNDGVGALPPPPPVQLEQGRDWNLAFDVMMESSVRIERALQQVGGRLGLLEDIQRQVESGESI